MMPTMENPQITLVELDRLEEQIKKNTALPKDYERLDKYLNFLGFENYLISKLRQSNVESFREFISRRKLGNSSNLNVLVGGVLGVLSFLRKYISGKV